MGALIREGRVLLAHRRPEKHAYPDLWDLPGGMIEVGESELEALARELREELGVQIATAAATPCADSLQDPSRSRLSSVPGSCLTGKERQRTSLLRSTTTSGGLVLKTCLRHLT